MDKFDEFLKKQAREEDKEFELPESFNKRIEDVLKEIDNDVEKNHRRKPNKKIIVAAASLAFVIIAGKAVMDLNSSVLNGNSSADMAKSINYTGSSDNSKSSSELETAYDGAVEESDLADRTMENSIKAVIADNIDYIIYNNEEINDEDKVNEIVSDINSMSLASCDEQDISNWIISMELIGNNNYVVKISDQYISINNVFYKCDEAKSKELIKKIKG